MGILKMLLGGGAGEAASAAGGLAKDIQDVFTTSDREKLAAYEAQTDRMRVSNEVAVAEAKHSSVFVAGARPAMIWVCTLGMLYHFILWRIIAPIMEHYTGVVLVDIDWQELWTAVTAALGLGAMRSYEKLKGVARNSVKNG